MTHSTNLAHKEATIGRKYTFQYISLPGIKMAYVDTGGNGKAVVLVHALAGTSTHWEFQLGEFSEAGYCVNAYDRRGWGESVPDMETGEQSGTANADLNRLVEHPGIERFHLIGISGGFLSV